MLNVLELNAPKRAVFATKQHDTLFELECFEKGNQAIAIRLENRIDAVALVGIGDKHLEHVKCLGLNRLGRALQ